MFPNSDAHQTLQSPQCTLNIQEMPYNASTYLNQPVSGSEGALDAQIVNIAPSYDSTCNFHVTQSPFQPQEQQPSMRQPASYPHSPNAPLQTALPSLNSTQLTMSVPPFAVVKEEHVPHEGSLWDATAVPHFDGIGEGAPLEDSQGWNYDQSHIRVYDTLPTSMSSIYHPSHSASAHPHAPTPRSVVYHSPSAQPRAFLAPTVISLAMLELPNSAGSHYVVREFSFAF